MNKEKIRKSMLFYERNLSKYACRDKDAIRLKKMKEDIRTNYMRDADKVLHSRSFTRYMDKTQVFTGTDNDNITKRMQHVLLVSKIGRTIGRALNLNEDLIEAIALGHDIGHVPFGHPGEEILNRISLKHLNEYFCHNVQSVRELMVLEKNGRGLNLSVQVLDGILCHNGEIELEIYKPDTTKSLNQFLEEYNSCYKDIKTNYNIRPKTMEGCVVRISDLIAYLGRDIEDAKELGVLKKDIPDDIKKVLGATNKDIVNTLILDIIDNSLDKPYIKMSKKVFDALSKLKKFNYENIYYKSNTEESLANYEEIFTKLFDYYLKEFNNKDCSINKVYLDGMTDDYINNTKKERIIIDYIAGMTDDYINEEYRKMCENEKI